MQTHKFSKFSNGDIVVWIEHGSISYGAVYGIPVENDYNLITFFNIRKSDGSNLTLPEEKLFTLKEYRNKINNNISELYKEKQKLDKIENEIISANLDEYFWYDNNVCKKTSVAIERLCRGGWIHWQDLKSFSGRFENQSYAKLDKETIDSLIKSILF